MSNAMGAPEPLMSRRDAGPLTPDEERHRIRWAADFTDRGRFASQAAPDLRGMAEEWARDVLRFAATLDASRDSRDGMREALTALVAAVDDGFGGLAVRIPNPGQRRAIVRAADEARTYLATRP